MLRELFPDAADAVEDADDDQGLELFAAKNGWITGTLADPKRGPQTLYSRVDPALGARRDVERWDPEGADTTVVLGVGLGYHLFALAKRFPDMPLVAVEARPALLRRSMEEFDWTPLLERDDFTLVMPGSALPGELLSPQAAIFAHQILFRVDLEFY